MTLRTPCMSVWEKLRSLNRSLRWREIDANVVRKGVAEDEGTAVFSY